MRVGLALAAGRTKVAAITVTVTVAMLAAISFALPAPARAQESPTMLAGTWTFTVTIASSNLPKGFEQRSGERTYYFGAGCALDDKCEIERTNQNGDRVKQSLAPAGGGWTWITKTPLDCLDKVTGKLRTRHGADFTVQFAFAPTDAVERDGVRYVAAMAGTIEASVIVNAKGRADQCTIPPKDSLETHASGTLTAVPVPLASLAPEALPAQLGSAPPPAATGAATIPGFTLPMTEEEARSSLAVARGDRSTVPAALVTPSDAASDSKRLVENLMLAALLALLMVFPAQIFNSTYEENHERIDAVLGRLPWRSRAQRVVTAAGEEGPPEMDAFSGAIPEDASHEMSSAGAGSDVSLPVTPDAGNTEAAVAVAGHRAGRGRRALIFVLVAAVGAIIGGFLDPGFGFHRSSIALLIGVFFSVMIGVGVAALAARSYRRAGSRPSEWVLHAIPSALLVAVVCVLISRLVKFQPGYLYGLVGGAAFVAALGRREEGRSEVAVIAAALALALVAWVVFGVVASQANDPHPAFGVLVADSLLAGLFIGGIEGLLFSLIPLRFLPGYRVKGWSWVVWIVLTAIVTFTFVNVLLRPASGYLGQSTQASVTLAGILFVAFGVSSVLFWLYFRLRPSTEQGSSPVPVASPVLDTPQADR